MSSSEQHGEPVYGSALTIVHGPDCCPDGRARAAGADAETVQQIEARVRFELGEKIHAERERIGAVVEREGRAMTEAELMKCAGLMSAYRIVTGRGWREEVTGGE